MRIAGVVAEYNPFHCGHAYHLRQMKALGADAVVAVMSGNFVQRGTPAILSKFARAKAAVQCGVDLVLELPVPWAVGRAQTFANGAISVLSQLGCVDVLSFGSECGDVTLLRETASALQDDGLSLLTQQILSGGSVTYAAARQEAVRQTVGEQAAAVLRDPNDTLAVEYMLAAMRQGTDFHFLAVPRFGRHDGEFADEGFASASSIRARLLAGDDMFGCPAAMKMIWEEQVRSGLAPADLRRMERAILTDWRTTQAEDLSALPDIAEGIERRIQDAAKHATSLTELYDLAKTKRYTHARIRRIVLARFLGLKQKDIPDHVPYLRVLAVGKQGKDILRSARTTCSVPILTRSADQRSLDSEACTVLQAERRAGELYAMLLPKVQSAGMEAQSKIYVSQ